MSNDVFNLMRGILAAFLLIYLGVSQNASYNKVGTFHGSLRVGPSNRLADEDTPTELRNKYGYSLPLPIRTTFEASINDPATSKSINF